MNSIHNGLKVPIAPHPPRPYGLTSMHDTEVPREDNWEALLHATFSDGSVGPPIPPIAYNDSIWGGQGIDVDIFTPRARVMVCACEVDGGLDHPLGKNVQQYPNHLGFCETSGIFVGGIWIELYGTETSIIWSHPWPDEITNKLAPETNIWGTITNSNLEIATIFPQEVTLISSIPEVVMTATQHGSKKY